MVDPFLYTYAESNYHFPKSEPNLNLYISKSITVIKFRGGRMDTKDLGLAVIMVVSSIVLTYKWLTRLGDRAPDSIILLAAVLLIGSLAGMILLLNMRLLEIQESINAKERSLRINIKGVEENLEKKMDEFAQKTNFTISEFSKRIYR